MKELSTSVRRERNNGAISSWLKAVNSTLEASWGDDIDHLHK